MLQARKELKEDEINVELILFSQLVGADRIAKYESDDDFVELYFDAIGRQRECVEFDVIQEIKMNPKEARVTVYDYYETSELLTDNVQTDTWSNYTCLDKQKLSA